jgi:hypothetical protein
MMCLSDSSAKAQAGDTVIPESRSGLLQAGVDRSMIALWLGHESVETTQIYLNANLALKEEILAKTNPLNGKPGRYRPTDCVLSFLSNL